MKNKIKPIFIFSLPRSGSTLLQKILASHPGISTVAEPWLLLPFVYANKKQGIISEYNEMKCHSAFEDFIGNLPNKENDYYKELGNFALKLYEKQVDKNAVYFLDKTPRYYYIIPEIIKMFPDAKFIFLFRNPAAIISSIINTWNNGRLRVRESRTDIFEGSKKLVEGYNLIDNSIRIKYEKLVQNPEKELTKVLQYLGLKYKKSMLTDFVDLDLKGKLGDPYQKNFSNITRVNLAKWKITFNTRFRKWYLSNLLKKLTPELINAMGYSSDELHKEIKEIQNSGRQNLFFDIFDSVWDYFVYPLKLRRIKKLLFRMGK